jgi:hypothetical protein
LGQHWDYGPLEVTVRFSKNQPGRPEPILITGVAHLSDYLYVIYDAYGQSVQLAYDRTNHERMVSQPIPVDYGVAHRIGIQSGSLFPHETHPFFKGWEPEKVRAARQTLRVTVDDVPFLFAAHPFFGATPEQVYVGTNPVSDNGGRKFTGELISVRRAPPGPAVADFTGGGFLHLALVLPPGQVGKNESILATGVAGRGDLLFIRYEDATHIRVGFQHSGEEPRYGDPMEIKPGLVQLLEISFGSFYPQPANARERELAGVLAVRWNGRTIWLETAAFHPAAGKPAIGKIDWAGAPVTGGFSGDIVGQHTVAARSAADSAFAIEPYWLESGPSPQWGPVRLRLRLPTDQVGKGEPLLVSGASAAQGDYLWINYPIAGQALIGYEHTGAGGPHTGLVPLDFSQTQTLEFSLPSLYPSGTDSYFASRTLQETAALTGRARLKLNGEVRFDAKVNGFESTPVHVTFGENRISQAFGTKFTGQILSIERGHLALPDGLQENLGALEMVLSLPEVPAGREVLLASGSAREADVLLVEYLSSNRIRFVAKPAKGEEKMGDTIEVDPAAKHELRIQWGGLYPEIVMGKKIAATEKPALQGSYTVTLDGKPVLSGRADFQQNQPQALAVGSSLGGEAGGFTGRFHSVRRLPR